MKKTNHRSVGVPPASLNESGQDAHAPVVGVPPASLNESGQDAHAPVAGVPPASLNESGQDAHAPVEDTPFFNALDDVDISAHKLPHWNQAKCFCFVTWRLDDALPKDKLDEWNHDREVWLKDHPKPWNERTERKYHELFSGRLDEWLDAGHGSCVLRQPASRKIVADALSHFDGVRYDLAAYVLMPNHVHALVKLKTDHPLPGILHSWKSFTAKAINKALGRTGSVWQPEYWDRLIRNERHFSACRTYIRDNPNKARLGNDSFTHWERDVPHRSVGVPPASLNESGQDAHAPVAGVPPASLNESGQDAHAPVAGVPPASLNESGQDAHAPTHTENSSGGFTLIELMVAMAVFAMMAVLLVVMVDGTTRVTGQSHRRISGDAGARQTLDRISADVARAIMRDDLPFRVDKTVGNDGISFLANVDGYTEGRGMSVISYNGSNGTLQRGVDATSWTDGSEAMDFTSVTNAAANAGYLERPGMDYEIIAQDVFRLEIAFLMGDGTIKANIGSPTNATPGVASLASSSGTSASNTIKAIIIGIASIDERAREALGTAGVTALQGAFPDAGVNQDLIATWEGYSSNSSYATNTPAVRQSVRVYQRYIPINN